MTGLRFIAAIHVVLYHNATLLQNGWPSIPDSVVDLVHIGYSGVNLFFVLSGFILAYTYATPGGNLRTTRRRFWVARFARIYPLYAFSLVLVAPLVIDHFLSTNQSSLGLLKITVSGSAAASLIQAWVPQLRGIWNPPAWSLSAEAFFYLLFPLLLPPIWRASRKKATILAACCWGFWLVPWLLTAYLVPAEQSVMATEAISNHPASVFLRSSPIFRLHEFVLGICLARICLDQDGNMRTMDSWWVRRGGSIMAIVLLAIVLFADRIPRTLVHAGMLDLFYVFLIVYLIQGRGVLCQLLGSRALVRLGEASYAIYILHVPIMSLMLLALGAGLQPPFGLELLVPYLAIVVAGSLLAFRFIEEPARRYVNGRAARGGSRALGFATD